MLAAGGDHDTRRNLRQIHKAGTRAAELTQQLLTFSKQQISRPIPLDLNVIIRDSEAMFRRLVGEDVHLVINTTPSLWLVMAEPSQMHQVLMNLLLNARDAMPNGGTLTIQTSNASLDQREVARADVPAGPYVAMVVSDTGVGMDEPTQQQIFEPFFTTTGVAGTGLGLSTVYGIVRQSGGTITVQSARHRGTTFTIYLPRTEQRLESQHVIETGSAQSIDGVRTILVVEDQDDVRGFAMDVLAASGYQVLAAPSGDAALEVATAHRGAIDLLLTDVVLRGMNGRELSTRFQTLHPESRVLFTSGYTDDILAQRGVLAASIAFLPKPYSPDGLRAKVRDTLSYERSA
jgi:CheY-like chemotaxis protein